MTTSLRKGVLRSFVRWLITGMVLIWVLAALMLAAARWIDPPTTAVHIQRRLQAWIHPTPYHERYKFIPLNQISPDLQHSVIAAEDARFYQHLGFDWHQIQIAAEDDLEGGRNRRPYRHGIMLHTMYYADEVRQLENFGQENVEVREAEIKIAHQLIQALQGKFEPEKFHDTFEDNLKALIKAHLEGKEVPAIPKPKPAPVTDLMAALKQSLAQMGEKKPAESVTELEEVKRGHAKRGRGKAGRKRAA